MKKNLRFSFLILAGIFLLFFAYVWKKKETDFYTKLKKIPDHSLVNLELGGKKYQVEVVNTTASITQGLSDRSEIGSDGMLFVMPAKSFYSFWMPRMSFALDLLWFNDQTLVEIIPNALPEPADKPLALLPLYTNQKLANLVLELPANTAATNQIQIGSEIKISY
ncbi:MAG: DUF192 domain-containing protein [bacterium]|nr:DUF192 domain-containing protein [bacterium]